MVVYSQLSDGLVESISIFCILTPFPYGTPEISQSDR